ncbi:MAG: TaqI-like C-terminal specificity domain-containing protein [Methanobacterium sp.]|jgi:hypothetical protein
MEIKEKRIEEAKVAYKPSFTIDYDGFFLSNTSYMMTSSDQNLNLKYLLVLLNSNLLFWTFKHITKYSWEKGLRFIKQYVEQLPIYQATKKEQQPFIKNADHMLELNRQFLDEVKS